MRPAAPRDPDSTRRQGRLQALVAEETASSAEELKTQLARMRADSLSILAKEERKIADERRRELAERERAAGEELADALAIDDTPRRRAAARVDGRPRPRATEPRDAPARLEQRQKQLIADAEARIEAEASELVSTSDEQRASVLRLREELERSAQSAVSEALEELEAHTAERRRVIEEIADRLRRREQALMEQVERGETEAASRIEMSFADIERRQVEQLQRVIAREAERYAEAAGVQFESTMRAAREEAAVRLSRELDRAVEMFVRQADTVFAERLSQTGDAGQQRLEARQRQAQSAFERQRTSSRRRLRNASPPQTPSCDGRSGPSPPRPKSERAALAERLAELSRRVDEATVSGEPDALRLTTRAQGTSPAARTARPMTDATELIERHSERAKVESWRLHVLIEAGYPLPLAEKLAAALDADLHEAVELVGQGCDPRTAAEILL